MAQRRTLRCRAYQPRCPVCLPVASLTPSGRTWRCCCRRPRDAGDPAVGRCGYSSMCSSTACAPAAPGAISRGSIHPGQPSMRRCADGDSWASGAGSTRRCAAPSRMVEINGWCSPVNMTQVRRIVDRTRVTAFNPRTSHDPAGAALSQIFACRSEERRVGKECRSRWSPYH